jgi:release factor glutamine methyltransferase
VTGWDRAALLTRHGSRLEPAVRAAFFSLVDERARRRPMQHLTGVQSFWRHDFLVTPAVLVPRPETELLVEAGIEALRGREAQTVVDVGTGSGCIALSLASELRDANVHAVDLSPAALAVARENARRLDLADRVRFHEGDLLQPLRSLPGAIDLVVSNPPYVDPSEAASLPPEVRDHEPGLALFAPGDRYSVYRRLVPEAAAAVRPDGFLILEVGMGMADEVRRICLSSGFLVTRVLDDLQGIPRTIVARRAERRATG